MGTTRGHLEREVKLGAWPGFRLPDLSVVAEGLKAVPKPDLRLHATYHDTPDVRLVRSGVTLRHRSGEGWTLKLPSSDENREVLSRLELTVAGDEAAVPTELARLLVSWVRTSALTPVALLHTRRRGLELVDADGLVAAEVVDDEVSVVHGRRLALRFREVEVELGQGAPMELLDAVVARLRAAGAGAADPQPKVVRALGPRAHEPPELEGLELGGDGSAAGVIRTGLAASVRRLLAHDLGVRLGEDAEDVHQARVATRRLRSDLRTYGPLLDEGWAKDLRAELRWVASALGEVRDADVLLEHLQVGLDGLCPSDAETSEWVVVRLKAERSAARARLLTVLDDRRYAVLLDRLVDALGPSRLDEVPASPFGSPAVMVPPGPGWLLAEAASPAVEVLPALVRKPWKRLRRAVKAIDAEGSDDELHQVRIRAKRCRYAAEVAALAVGKPARKLAGAVADLQEVLGDHHDAVVAEAWLRAAVPELTSAEALVAGQLIAGQREVAAASRRKWPETWARANRRKLRSWLTG
ncbi:MAG: CHAD domain-containing protein [Acidimicrobiales bacterium]